MSELDRKREAELNNIIEHLRIEINNFDFTNKNLDNYFLLFNKLNQMHGKFIYRYNDLIEEKCLEKVKVEE